MEDDYEPPGILKANWMAKVRRARGWPHGQHGQKIPAVILYFHSADFDAANWEQLQEAIAATVKAIGYGERSEVCGSCTAQQQTAGIQGLFLCFFRIDPVCFVGECRR